MQYEKANILVRAQASTPLVLFSAFFSETVADVAKCLDYRRYNLLATRRQADAVYYLQAGMADVLLFEPPEETTASGLLEIFLAEKKIRVPVLLLVGEGDSKRFLDKTEYSFDELLTRPVNQAELSARLNSLVKLGRLEGEVGILPEKSEDKRQTVLIVEDSQVQRKVMGRYLEEQNIKVVFAASGEEALELIGRSVPDLILLDIQMPIMDGWEFVRTYRQSPGPHAPIIVLTGGRSGPAYAREAGAQGSLPKPFSLSRLLAVIDEQTSRASRASSAA